MGSSAEPTRTIWRGGYVRAWASLTSVCIKFPESIDVLRCATKPNWSTAMRNQFAGHSQKRPKLVLVLKGLVFGSKNIIHDGAATWLIIRWPNTLLGNRQSNGQSPVYGFTTWSWCTCALRHFCCAGTLFGHSAFLIQGRAMFAHVMCQSEKRCAFSFLV